MYGVLHLNLLAVLNIMSVLLMILASLTGFISLSTSLRSSKNSKSFNLPPGHSLRAISTCRALLSSMTCGRHRSLVLAPKFAPTLPHHTVHTCDRCLLPLLVLKTAPTLLQHAAKKFSWSGCFNTRLKGGQHCNCS
jgi:hypothetical protein